MKAYSEEYLNDVVENQGKLFDLVSQQYPAMDTEEFINSYMISKTRKRIYAILDWRILRLLSVVLRIAERRIDQKNSSFIFEKSVCRSS